MGCLRVRAALKHPHGRPAHPRAAHLSWGTLPCPRRHPEVRGPGKNYYSNARTPRRAQASNVDRKGRPQQHAVDARCPVDRTQSRDKNKQAAMTTDLTRHRVVAHERVVATSTEALRETVVACVESSRQRVTLSRELLRVLRELPRRRGDTIPSMAWSA